MKTFKHLFDKLISYDNLSLAIKNSSKRKTGRADVQEILQNKDIHIRKIQELLLTKQFRVRKHKGFLIYDGMSRKQRLIIKPDYVYEQIIHHAIVQVLRPMFSRGMYEYSCGSIPGRGGHMAKKYIQRFMKRHNRSDYKYIMKLDIRKYFQSVAIPLLKQKVRKYVKDDRMVWLIDVILDSNVAEVNGKDVEAGLPIGYYTSQWFANWILQDLDHMIKEHLHINCYVRYMDDMVLFGRNKKDLHAKMEIIKNALQGLELAVKDNHQVFRFDYFDFKGQRKGRVLDFIGFKFYREKVVLRKSILLKATRKAKRIRKKKNITWYDASQMVSYIGWFRYTKTRSAYLKYIKPYVKMSVCKGIISRHSKKEKNRNECKVVPIGEQKQSA